VTSANHGIPELATIGVGGAAGWHPAASTSTISDRRSGRSHFMDVSLAGCDSGVYFTRQFSSAREKPLSGCGVQVQEMLRKPEYLAAVFIKEAYQSIDITMF
jgi:hypothetical protein